MAVLPHTAVLDSKDSRLELFHEYDAVVLLMLHSRDHETWPVLLAIAIDSLDAPDGTDGSWSLLHTAVDLSDIVSVHHKE